MTLTVKVTEAVTFDPPHTHPCGSLQCKTMETRNDMQLLESAGGRLCSRSLKSWSDWQAAVTLGYVNTSRSSGLCRSEARAARLKMTNVNTSRVPWTRQRSQTRARLRVQRVSKVNTRRIFTWWHITYEDAREMADGRYRAQARNLPDFRSELCSYYIPATFSLQCHTRLHHTLCENWWDL